MLKIGQGNRVNLIKTHSFGKLFDKFFCFYFKVFVVVVVDGDGGGDGENFNVYCFIPRICTNKFH